MFHYVSLCLTLASAGRPGTWEKHAIAVDFHSFTLVAADFSGDGRIDVLANGGSRDEDVLFSAPRWTRTVLHSGVKATHSTLGDMDGDGDVDYVSARYRPGLIHWLERPAHPLTDPWPDHIIDAADRGGVDGVHGLAVTDVDHDGRADLLANSGWPEGPFADSLVWFSAPRWQRHLLADHDAAGLTHYLTVGDVNGDGRVDVTTAAKAGHWFGWWEAPPQPTQRWTKHVIAEQQAGATNILLADINGDRTPDFIASRGHGQGLVWFEAPSWKAHEIDDTLLGPHALAIADVDGDGALDLVTCAKDSKIVAVFRGDGHGRFVRRDIDRHQAGYDLHLVDLDGDRDLDVLLAGQDSRNIVWYENRR